ncbi:hypothetical protein IFM89_018231 [Coptis chinensis]|uniref:OTU domain-containing protein n=1 Tax=Coptis chinensis TaxID=261450 RepID=A0A835I4D4_9MAGN|nr:hypothetical protein IFM89_018231 [Coptis chinensis]
MARILVQRGSASNNQSRSVGSSLSGTSTLVPQVQVVNVTRDEQEEEVLEIGSLDNDSLDSCVSFEEKTTKRDELFGESNQFVVSETVSDDEKEKVGSDDVLDSGIVMKELGGLRIRENVVGWPEYWYISDYYWPSSPRSYGEGEGYNSADEQSPCFGSTCDDANWSCFHEISGLLWERERQFELEIIRVEGFELKCMLEDGNCLFRAVAYQVYGGAEAYDLTRQMCTDYMCEFRWDSIMDRVWVVVTLLRLGLSALAVFFAIIVLAL